MILTPRKADCGISETSRCSALISTSSYRDWMPHGPKHHRENEASAIALCRVGCLYTADGGLLHRPRAPRSNPCRGCLAITRHRIVRAVGRGQNLSLMGLLPAD